MGKNEFLETLREQLSRQMQEGSVAAHVQYYRNYIESEINSGRTEEEVLAELGDPRLIAKTLNDTSASPGSVYDAGYGGDAYEEGPGGSESCSRIKRRSYHLDLSTWYGKLIVIAIAALVVIALLVVIGTVLPGLIIAGVILMIISRLRNDRR